MYWQRLFMKGKLKYFEKCMLPETTDEIIFGFTPDQMKFCRNNESQMWQYLIENNLLFSSDQFTIHKLTGEAPLTSFFTKESPGRAAVWLGFRIIESYMMKNPEIKMGDMMKEYGCSGYPGESEIQPAIKINRDILSNVPVTFFLNCNTMQDE